VIFFGDFHRDDKKLIEKTPSLTEQLAGDGSVCCVLVPFGPNQPVLTKYPNLSTSSSSLLTLLVK
jgi:hypothetical protein